MIGPQIQNDSSITNYIFNHTRDPKPFDLQQSFLPVPREALEPALKVAASLNLESTKTRLRFTQ